MSEKFEAIDYGQRIQFQLSPEQTQRLKNGEPWMDVFWGITPEIKAEWRVRDGLQRVTRGITEAALFHLTRCPGTASLSAIIWLIEQTKAWRDHECDY